MQRKLYPQIPRKRMLLKNIIFTEIDKRKFAFFYCSIKLNHLIQRAALKRTENNNNKNSK